MDTGYLCFKAVKQEIEAGWFRTDQATVGSSMEPRSILLTDISAEFKNTQTEDCATLKIALQ